MKHIPMRSCIVCRQQKDKTELLRIVKKPSGEIVLDETGRESGRGAYVCKSGECMTNAIKKRAFNRVYKQQLPDAVYEKLEMAYGNIDASN
ncbi:MAG: YlxR family protein [Clostridiales bacterium]|nr:YlxR family protein [Clostridiales bacterium]